MFGGSYTHSLDSVGRFVMPKKMRNSLGDDFIITKGVGCLCVFTEDYVNQLLKPELDGLGTALERILNPDIARLNRHFFSEMVTTSADGQFRVQLTAEHRRYAHIENDVVICGCGDWVELWSPAVLESYRQNNDQEEDIIASGAALLTARRNRQAEGDAGVSPASPL